MSEPRLLEIWRLRYRGCTDEHAEMARELLALRTENERLRRESMLPGEYRCERCGFEVSKPVLRASDGAVGIDPREHREACPNGCGDLVPVTYRHAFEVAAKSANDAILRGSKAETALDTAREALRRIDGIAGGAPAGVFWEISQVARAALGQEKQS